MMAYPYVGQLSNCGNCSGPIVEFHVKILHCHHKQTTYTVKFYSYYRHIRWASILLMDTHFRL